MGVLCPNPVKSMQDAMQLHAMNFIVIAGNARFSHVTVV